MILRITAFFLIIVSLSTTAENISNKVFVSKNEAGEMVFSDKAQVGSNILDITQSNNVITAIHLPFNPLKKNSVLQAYTIEIVLPENQATIRDNTGTVRIASKILPGLKQGHAIALYLDNEAYGEPQTLPLFVLKDIYRGAHTLKMLLLNDKGKVIALSKDITFYMHRASK